MVWNLYLLWYENSRKLRLSVYTNIQKHRQERDITYWRERESERERPMDRSRLCAFQRLPNHY